MSSASPIFGYSYRAIDVMARLSLRHQRQIELLRKECLAKLALSGQARIISNYPEIEYRYNLNLETLKVNINYYLNNLDGEVVIFSIEWFAC